MKGALIDNQRSSNKFAASGNRSALRLPGSFRRRGFQPDHFMETSLCGWTHSPRGISCRPAHAAGGILTLRAFLQMFYLIIEICICRKLMPDMAEGRGSVGDISFYSKDCRTE